MQNEAACLDIKQLEHQRFSLINLYLSLEDSFVNVGHLFLGFVFAISEDEESLEVLSFLFIIADFGLCGELVGYETDSNAVHCLTRNVLSSLNVGS